MRHRWTWLGLWVLFSACSSAPSGISSPPPKDEPQAEAPVLPTPGEYPQYGMMLPALLELSATPESDGTVINIAVDIREALPEGAMLRITPHEGSTMMQGRVSYQPTGSPRGRVQPLAQGILETLPRIEKGQSVERQVFLTGDSAGLDVTLSIFEDGLSVEIHESYPPPESSLPREIRRENPAPVEVGGIEIRHAVDVRP
ncbi:MAG: hypothetical protein FWC40_03750 [Proteobacteria bacterium]|nr:hypothetical protein [Pseudomonadota bacterium]